jgi:hypothetical protein
VCNQVSSSRQFSGREMKSEKSRGQGPDKEQFLILQAGGLCEGLATRCLRTFSQLLKKLRKAQKPVYRRKWRLEAQSSEQLLEQTAAAGASVQQTTETDWFTRVRDSICAEASADIFRASHCSLVC